MLPFGPPLLQDGFGSASYLSKSPSVGWTRPNRKPSQKSPYGSMEHRQDDSPLSSMGEAEFVNTRLIEQVSVPWGELPVLTAYSRSRADQPEQVVRATTP